MDSFSSALVDLYIHQPTEQRMFNDGNIERQKWRLEISEGVGRVDEREQ